MLVDIYKSTLNGTIFVAVPAGTDMEKIGLPNRPELVTLQRQSAAVKVEAGKNLIAMDADDVLSQIGEQGYAVFGATITVTRAGSD